VGEAFSWSGAPPTRDELDLSRELIDPDGDEEEEEVGGDRRGRERRGVGRSSSSSRDGEPNRQREGSRYTEVINHLDYLIIIVI
jgi:hypothetical protein